MVMLTFCIFLFVWFSHTPLDVRSNTASTVSVAGKININTASADELESLPGIGEKLASAIVTYREENGSFSGIGELAEVPGIGAGKLEAIADLITVGG